MKVRVTLGNRWARLERPYPYEALNQEWSFSVPNYQFMKWKFPGWDGRKKFLKDNYVPAGLFRATREEIEKRHGIKFKVFYQRETVETRSRMHSDRDYQNDCVTRMLGAIRRGGGLILNATGSGKTRIAALFASAVVGKICFIVDQLDLLDQAREELEDTLGEKIGYVGNSKFEPARITVATVQTLARHRKDIRFLPWTETLDIVIIDEIHVQMNRSNFSVVENIEPKAVFGLTATLQMRKKEVRIRAWALAGPVLFEYPVKQGMDEKVLSKGIVVRVLVPNHVETQAEAPERNMQRLRASYNDIYIQKVVKNPERNHVISRLIKYGIKHGKYGIILVERIKHLKRLSKRLESIPHEVIYGEREVKERHKARKKFEQGNLKLIIANRVFKKGINIKRVDVMVDGAAMKNPDDALQKFGRGLRLHKEKSGLIYFDIADIDPSTDKLRREKLKSAKNDRQRSRAKRIKNTLAEASKKRKKAFIQAGLKVIEIPWDLTTKTSTIYMKAEQALRKEIHGHS